MGSILGKVVRREVMLEQRMERRERSAFQAQSTVMVQQAWGQHVLLLLGSRTGC